MHVVISGYYGFDNVGDEAILFSIIQALREVDPKITITVLSNNPESTMDTYEVNAVNRWKVNEVNRAIRAADGLISGGGSLLQDKTGIKSIPYYTGIIKLAQWNKKPTFIYAQGIGPIKRRVSKWFTRSILNRVDKITVRDEYSQNLLSEIGIKQPTTIVPDPVLGLDGSQYSNKWTKKQGFNKPFISVSVRDWPTDEPYKEKIAKCLDELVQDGYHVVFVPMHGNLDEVTSKETAALMTEKSYLSPSDLSIEEKISVIGESKLLIGIRLHSLIFAAINCTPFVALSYDPKIDAFAAIFEQPVVGHVATDTWDTTRLLDAVNHALKHSAVHVELLKAKVEKYQAQAREIPKSVIEVFSK